MVLFQVTYLCHSHKDSIGKKCNLICGLQNCTAPTVLLLWLGGEKGFGARAARKQEGLQGKENVWVGENETGERTEDRNSPGEKNH